MTYIEAILKVAAAKEHKVSVKLTIGSTLTLRTVCDVCKDKARFGIDFVEYDSIKGITVHSPTIVEAYRLGY